MQYCSQAHTPAKLGKKLMLTQLIQQSVFIFLFLQIKSLYLHRIIQLYSIFRCKMKNVLIFFLLVSLLIGCKDDSQSPNAKLDRNPFPYFMTSDNYDGYLYTAYIITKLNIDRYSYQYQQYDDFYDSITWHLIYPDSVQLNGVILRNHMDYLQIPFDSIYHTWRVYGTYDNYIPSFTDSIKPIPFFNLNSPIAYKDTLNFKNDIVLNYSQIQNLDSILVFLETDNFMAKYLIDSTYFNSDSPHVSKGLAFKNTGLATIPKETLSDFPTLGVVKINLVAARHKIRVINNKKFIIATMTSFRSNHIFHK